MKDQEPKNIAISPINIIFEDKDYLLYKFDTTIQPYSINYKAKDHFVELHLCQKGTASLVSLEKKMAISEQQSLLFYDSQMKEVSLNLDINTTSYLLQLSLTNLHSLLSNNHKSLEGGNIFATQEPIIDIKTNSTEVINTIAELDTKQSNDGLKKLFLKGKIFEIISYLGKETQKNEVAKCPFTSVKKNNIIMAKDILIENLKSAPKIEEIASMLNMSQKVLKSEFKAMYGLPIYTYYMNYKLEIAKDLLDQKESSITDISSHIGYSTTSHFIAAFKKKYQTTPKQYQLQ